jgi:hypothetical protein
MRGLPEVLLGVTVGIVGTYVAWERSDAANTQEAVASKQRYQRECVHDFQNGWHFDKCERDSLLKIDASIKGLEQCNALISKPTWTLEEFQIACATDEDGHDGK